MLVSHTDARRSYWVVTHSCPTNVCWGELHDKTKELLHVRLPGARVGSVDEFFHPKYFENGR